MLLPLSIEDVIPRNLRVRLEAQRFAIKDELHVTVFDDKPGSDVRKQVDALTHQHRQDVADLIKRIVSGSVWEIIPESTYRVLTKKYDGEAEPRESVIQLVKCPQLDSFYSELGSLLHHIVVPPAHITLATRGNARGIGISSMDDLVNYGAPWQGES